MPLSMVKQGEANVIRKVGGKEETRRFLENHPSGIPLCAEEMRYYKETPFGHPFMR